jgi:hypothetical protein
VAEVPALAREEGRRAHAPRRHEAEELTADAVPDEEERELRKPRVGVREHGREIALAPLVQLGPNAPDGALERVPHAAVVEREDVIPGARERRRELLVPVRADGHRTGHDHDPERGGRRGEGERRADRDAVARGEAHGRRAGALLGAKVLVFPPAIQHVGPRSFGLRHHVPCLHRRHLRWTLWSDRPLVKGDGSILSPVETSVSPVET